MRFSKRLLGTLLVVFCAPLVLMAQTSVAEHWSPYNYPKEIPEGTKYHVIAEGDTLWSITEHYLGDPLLWPQVYARNAYILDPNLIYPGDPVLLDVGTVVGDSMASDDSTSSGDIAESMDAESGEFADLDEVGSDDADSMDDDTQGDEDISNVSEVTDFDSESSEFVILPAGNRSDMECSTYIYSLNNSADVLPFDIKVSGGENRAITNYGVGDVLYINKGRSQGLVAGVEYGVRRELERVYGHDRKLHGVAIDQVGNVKILAVQAEGSIAVVLPSCYNIRVGDFLVPYEQEPIPLITELPALDRYTAFSTADHGRIIYSEDNLRSFGKGHLVNVDMGIDRNIAPGDIFIIYRDNPANNLKNGVDLPPVFLGHAVALKASAQSTVMKIIAGVGEISVGDKIVPLEASESFD